MKKIILSSAVCLIFVLSLVSPIIATAQEETEDGPFIVDIERQIDSLKKMVSEFQTLKTTLSKSKEPVTIIAPILEIANAPEVAIVVADLTGDGMVDVKDLKSLMSEWGTCFEDSACDADLDENNSVDIADLKILLKNWAN